MEPDEQADRNLLRQHPLPCVHTLEHPLVHIRPLHVTKVMPHHGDGARQHGGHQWLLGQLLLSQHRVCHVLLHALHLWGLVEEDGASQGLCPLFLVLLVGVAPLLQGGRTSRKRYTCTTVRTLVETVWAHLVGQAAQGALPHIPAALRDGSIVG